MKIGLLSDTHGWLDPQIMPFFHCCDEIWHAGDIGDIAIIEQLCAFKPTRAVYGNIDDQHIRTQVPADQHFICAGASIWITHIGGKPPRYTPTIHQKLVQNCPDIFICGHSHQLQVKSDPQFPNFKYLNPGAAGKQGFHIVRTALRFTIQKSKIQHIEAIELGPRATLVS